VVRKITSNPSQIAIILKPRTARSGLLSFNPEVGGLLPSLILGMPPGTFVTLEVVLDRHVPLGMPPGTFVTLGMTLIIQRGNS